MLRKYRAIPPSPFCRFNSSPELIRLVVLTYAYDATMARLTVSAQAGDRQAYGVLLAEASRWLKRYFARRSAPGAVDDLIQESLLSVHRKLASFDPERPFLPWLAAIARYRWVDHLRRA